MAAGRKQTYSEPKRDRTLTLTDLAWGNLQVISKSFQMKPSELVEQIARGKISTEEVYKKATGELSAS